MKPTLYIVSPCYNEALVLPITAPLFLKKLKSLIDMGKIDSDSKILFVDDGSRDDTWKIITEMANNDAHFSGICLSRNRGHQNALLAGLYEVTDKCDIAISIDCDGQDDINAMDKMVDEYLSGSDIVYGVRSSRKNDSFFKRNSAQMFYRLMKSMGVETVYNHADYRLLSSRVLKSFSNFKEVNIFLRGMIPLVGFKSTCVYYERNERIAGKSHYSLKKMLSLAVDGITSLSIKPIRLITALGIAFSLLGIIGVILSIIFALIGKAFIDTFLILTAICLLGGIQLTAIGVIGEYVGKSYLETKARPRFIISEKTGSEKE